MIGVALFGGLMFTLSRGARQGGDNITDKQAELAASEMLDYAQRVERGVANVMRTASFSEVDISFDNDIATVYENTNCSSARCEVFNAGGGAINYRAPSDNMRDGTDPWIFSGDNAVAGIGTTAPELLLMLNNVHPSVCEEINDRLNIDPMPTDGDDIDTTTYFQGAYTASAQISGAAVDGLSSGCVQNTARDPDEYLFYHVLRAR